MSQSFAKTHYCAKIAVELESLHVRNEAIHDSELDMHGLSVTACLYACHDFLGKYQRMVSAAKCNKNTTHTLTIITGWGKHSSDGRCKLKPAVRGYFEDFGYQVKDAKNPGVLIVTLT